MYQQYWQTTWFLKEQHYKGESQMTKAELIKALEEYDDNHEISLVDMRYYSEEFMIRNISLLKITWTMNAAEGIKKPLLYIESDTLVQDVEEPTGDCMSCKHFGLPENGPMAACKLDRERECIMDNYSDYEFFNK